MQILTRSFNRYEQKKIVYGAIICGLLLFCSLFKFPLIPDPSNSLNFQVSMGIELKMLALKSTNTSLEMIPKTALSSPILNKNNQMRNVTINNGIQNQNSTQQHDYDPRNSSRFRPESSRKEKEVLVCDTQGKRTEFCEINTVARVDSNSSSVLIESDTFADTVRIRPYARKGDHSAMSRVKNWSVVTSRVRSETSRCTRNHSVPAVLFSVGGYVGNNFHEFTDIVIPLFITSVRFQGEVRFVITNYRPYFVKKFEKVLKGLSNYEPIEIDRESREVHCFQSATIGLKRHDKELAIDPEKHSTSMKEFRDFLMRSYSLERPKAMRIKGGDDGLRRKKPRLLILSRRRTRAFTNTDEISKMARSLGFKVTVTEADKDLNTFSKIVNSCDVLMGIHGAGLTNIVFLPENAVFIQILPFGGFEWLAKTDFGLPSKDMRLNYLEYKISKEESTLINEYPIDHKVFTDPSSIGKSNWGAFKSIFLEKQNVNLDLNRFKPTLVKALELLPR